MINLKHKNGGITTTQSHHELLHQVTHQHLLQRWLPSQGSPHRQRYHLPYPEFIARVADKSNIMCESVQKKTISSEHLQAALTVILLLLRISDSPTIFTNSDSSKKTSKNKTSSKDSPTKNSKKCSPKKCKRNEKNANSNNKKKRLWPYDKNSQKSKELILKSRKTRIIKI